MGHQKIKNIDTSVAIYKSMTNNSSKKNIIIDNKTSSLNMAVVRVENIERETSMPSSETTMSLSESGTSHISDSSVLMKDFLQRSRYCRFSGCKYTSDYKNIHFYRFPREKKRCKAWVEASNNKALIGVPAAELYKRAHLCMHHFEDWCFLNIVSKHRLVHDAIPCCTKLQMKKILASNKASNSTLSINSNDAENNSSALKQLLISSVSCQASSAVSEDSSNDSEEITLVPIKSGNSTIFQYFPPEAVPIRTIQCEDASSKIVFPEKITSGDSGFRNVSVEDSISTTFTSQDMLLTTVKTEDSFTNDNNSGNIQETNLPRDHVEFVNGTYSDIFSEPTDSNESEDVNCVTHAEAFSAAKTLLHYLINQNDVDNPDMNFILNLTKKIEKRLTVKKEISSESL